MHRETNNLTTFLIFAFFELNTKNINGFSYRKRSSEGNKNG